jgi:hypothetical protein
MEIGQTAEIEERLIAIANLQLWAAIRPDCRAGLMKAAEFQRRMVAALVEVGRRGDQGHGPAGFTRALGGDA